MGIKTFILGVNMINAILAMTTSMVQTKRILKQSAHKNRINTILLCLLAVLAIVTSAIQSNTIVSKILAKQS
jgi:hypothetical protein